MSSNDNRAIGVFDSGLGGLTVIAALLKELPEENFVYLGDTARVPYGGKSVRSLLEFARQDAEFLLSQNVKLIVAACNTVSSVAMPALQEVCGSIPYLGVIDSGVNAVISSGAKSVLVTGTRTTVSSGAYANALQKAAPGIHVESVACPLLVPLAEEGITAGPIVEHVLDLYFAPYRKTPPDAVLLGCTHYPLFKSAIESYFSRETLVIDSGSACAAAVKKILKTNNLSADSHQTGSQVYYATDYPAGFHILAERFLGRSIERVSTVVLSSEN
ncbi:MAG: glutamate racemase [Lentisphaeria bacterium]|nr:glutamate racemase [Lentisphaeria bacterium]